MQTATLDDDELAMLARIGTGPVSDALDSLQLPAGAISGLRAFGGAGAAAGHAATVLQRAASPGRTRHLEFIDRSAPQGSIVVIDAGGTLEVCSLGALIARRASTRGLAGIVVNGAVRDVGEIPTTGMPVLAAGSSPRRSGAGLTTVDVQVEVTIAGVSIQPGDVLVMDETGLVRIPLRDARRVLAEASRIDAVERRVSAMVADGRGLVESFEAAGTGGER